MRTITIATDLDAPADLVWAAVQTPQAFVHVTGGLLRYPPAERVDRPWRVGDRLVGWTLLLGFIPFSRHRIDVVEIDEDARRAVSDESGGPIQTWRHVLTTTPLDAQRCRYEDRIEIDAGSLTDVVAAFASVFYRYRQRRWRQLARLLVAVEQARRR